MTIILPEGVNATCDITRKMSGVKNLVDNVDEEGIHTVYVIGKAVCSSVEIIPVNFYVDEEDEEDSDFVDEEDDFDDSVIFNEKEGDVEVEVKVINEKEDKASDSGKDKKEDKASDSDKKDKKDNKKEDKKEDKKEETKAEETKTEEPETINLEEV